MYYKRILMTISWRLRPVFFRALSVGLLFGQVSLGPPFAESSENGRFGCPCGICHNPALRALLEPPFAPKSCPMNVL